MHFYFQKQVNIDVQLRGYHKNLWRLHTLLSIKKLQYPTFGSIDNLIISKSQACFVLLQYRLQAFLKIYTTSCFFVLYPILYVESFYSISSLFHLFVRTNFNIKMPESCFYVSNICRTNKTSLSYKIFILTTMTHVHVSSQPI